MRRIVPIRLGGLGRACGKKKEMGQKGRKMVGRQGEMNQARKERERREARVGLEVDTVFLFSFY
jgi:hypothetical protein